MKLHNVSQKLSNAHLVSGEMTPGTEIGFKIEIPLSYNISERQVGQLLKGGVINFVKQK